MRFELEVLFYNLYIIGDILSTSQNSTCLLRTIASHITMGD